MVDKISGQVGVQAAGGNKMARRGENIRKRKDGRWEGRYIKARTPEGKIQWGYVYGIVYAEVTEKSRGGLLQPEKNRPDL